MKTPKQSIADSPESHDFALDALLERAALADPIDAQAYARLEARVLTQSLPHLRTLGMTNSLCSPTPK